MNYQPQYRRTGMLSDLAPQEQGDLSQLLMYMDQPEYTQQPMILAQNTQQPNMLQRMLGTQGDGVSAQTKAGIEKNLPGFYETAQHAPAAPGYGLGQSTKEELALRERQRIAAAVKLGLPPTATDAQIRDAQMKLNASKKPASPGTR
jgi:hypothetical protein